MANTYRGERSLEVAGKVWTLRFTVNSLCALEDDTGQSVTALSDALTNPAKMRLGMVRAVLWAGLLHHHPKVTHAEAGELLDAAGIGPVAAKIGEAFSLAFPEAAVEEGERPPMPGQSGTGPAS